MENILCLLTIKVCFSSLPPPPIITTSQPLEHTEYLLLHRSTLCLKVDLSMLGWLKVDLEKLGTYHINHVIPRSHKPNISFLTKVSVLEMLDLLLDLCLLV